MFLVFAGDNYYPAGGWDDFIAKHDTREEAEGSVEKTNHYGYYSRWKINEQYYDWYHVVDMSTMTIVKDNYGDV